ncbi:MAG: PQQ-binding-like beta-propeller repeat protein [Elusimicrobia bacterium]|nr:PQQ-binding-like beta-propeller repeat protein [Elusimicrobiota bacterium]
MIQIDEVPAGSWSGRVPRFIKHLQGLDVWAGGALGGGRLWAYTRGRNVLTGHARRGEAAALEVSLPGDGLHRSPPGWAALTGSVGFWDYRGEPGGVEFTALTAAGEKKFRTAIPLDYPRIDLPDAYAGPGPLAQPLALADGGWLLSGETSGAESAGGQVFLLDPHGRLLWKADGRAVALSKKTVVVNRGFDGVAGLDRENGEERWTKTLSGAEDLGGGADVWGFILPRGSEKGFHVHDAETGERRFALPCMEKTDLELKGRLRFGHGAAILCAEPLEFTEIVDGQGKRRARWRSAGRFVGFDGRRALFATREGDWALYDADKPEAVPAVLENGDIPDGELLKPFPDRLVVGDGGVAAFNAAWGRGWVFDLEG